MHPIVPNARKAVNGKRFEPSPNNSILANLDPYAYVRKRNLVFASSVRHDLGSYKNKNKTKQKPTIPKP